MALALQDINAPPVERFHFPVKQTSFVVDASNYNALFENIRKHCEANNIQPPSDQEVIDYLCVHTHVKCYDTETRIPLANKLTLNLPFVAAGCCGKARK